MTTRTFSTKRAIIFLSTHILFTFALAVVFLPSAWAGEDLSTLRSKAEAGDPKAQNNLGLLYENRLLDPQDISKAAYWFRLAAKQGYVDAQNDLGDLYATGGPGLPQDFSKAAYWHLLATGHH